MTGECCYLSRHGFDDGYVFSPGERCAIDLDITTVTNSPRTDATPGERCAIDLDITTVTNFPRTGATPGEMCAMDVDFMPSMNFPRTSSNPGEIGAVELGYRTMMPSISGVAIDTLLFSRIGSPLCHHHQIISHTGSHAAFRGTYWRRVRAFLEESDSAVVRRLHRQLAQELAARIALPTDSPASGPSRSAVGHRTVSRSRRPRRLKGVTDSSRRPESVCHLPAEVSSVQALMDLSLPRFAGLGDGPRQIHPPWSIASDSPASPAPARLETSGEEDSCGSVDQMSVSSACLNLDLFSSSSEDDSKDSAERSDLSITLFCDSDEAGTCVNSDQVLSDADFPEESVPKDKRQDVRRCASPPGGQIMGAALDDQQYEPPLPVVDLVTGRCKPGKVSITVSMTPLTLDLTVVCISSAVVPPPGVSSNTVVPPATVANEGIDVGTSVPVVAAPAPVVEQPSPPVRGFMSLSFYSLCCQNLPSYFLCPDGRPRLPHQRYRGEQQMTHRRPFRLTVFRRDTLRMFRTRAVCLMCHRFRQDSSFGHHEGVSRLWLRNYYYQRRWTTSMIRFWEIRSHMRGVNSFRCQSPHCLCLCMRGRLVLPSDWIPQYFRLCWLQGPPLCRRRGPRPLLRL